MAKTRILDVTLSLNTSAYANADLLADTQSIDNAFGEKVDGTGTIKSLVVIDEDDQTLYVFSVWFLEGTGSLGTENSAPSATDAVCRTVLAKVDFATTDGLDLGDAKVYSKTGLSIPVRAIVGTNDLGIAAVVTTGTPTHTAAGIRVRIGIELD
jgi:hypothetical protein